MSSKNTWLWITVAAVLFASILIFERYFRHAYAGPNYLLPGLNTEIIRTLQIRRAGQLDISVERTNAGWRIVEPIAYPAQSIAIQNLLTALQRLTVMHGISEQEFRKDTNADTDYGVDPPQLSLILNSLPPIYFGRRTAPGDEVFVRIIGIGGVSVVDADVLNLFPPNPDGWRETALANLERTTFDRITVTNTAKSQSFQFQNNPTNKVWNMTLPMVTRADVTKVEDLIQSIDKLRVRQFVSDDPKIDLDAFGLQPAGLTITLGKGTNTLLTLDFGKELTNSPGMLYARRRDQNTVVAISTNSLTAWQASYETFRDRHLVTLTAPLEKITVHAQDDFSLEWHTNNSWRVMPQDFPADNELAAWLARTLGELQVADFEKDSVTEAAWPQYGLAPPSRKYVLSWADSGTGSNAPIELDFGTNSDGKTFARRVGEEAVYGITATDFERLPTASWEMHERQIWNFDVNDTARITIQQDGKTREIIHATNGWSLAVGGQGVINDSAVENTVRELGHLSAFWWVGHGAKNVANFGFTPQGHQISIELKNGTKLNVQFGSPSRFGSPYAVVLLNNEPWIFEFPPDLYPSVQYCLTIPSGP